MPIVTASYQAPWWMRGPHRQTIWNTVIGRKPHVDLRRERFELADGDFVDVDWLVGGTGPIVVVLHGLEGSSESPYVRGLLQQIQYQGWRGLVLNFRGCSGESNRLMRAYHSGDTGDVAEVIGVIRSREPDVRLFGVGYSLGGNVLLKWMGENGDTSPLDGAVAVSVPFDLDTCADCLNQGLSRVYERRFVQGLKSKYAQKAQVQNVSAIRTIRQWDEHVTAPFHGFKGAKDYYTRCSSGPFLKSITVPTLVLHASDDPFMNKTVIPAESDLSPTVTLEISKTGGHVGFVMGSPLRPVYWLEQRIPAFLRALVPTEI